jgi:hypothetical protein
LKFGGCFAIHLRTFLNQSSLPLDQNLAHFKIRLNFGRIHQNLTLFFSFFLFLSPTRPRWHPGQLVSLPLPYPLALAVGHKEWGEARGKSFKDLHPTSLSLQPPSTPNQHRATAQVHPRTPPASACLPPAPHPLPRSPRSPLAHPCRPRCRGQASPCHRAINSPQPPSSTPNRSLPPTPPVGHPLARVLSRPVHALDAESGIAVPKHAVPPSPRSARHPARHRTPSNVPTSPSTLAIPSLLAVQRKCCSWTEPARLTVGSVQAGAPRPHH